MKGEKDLIESIKKCWASLFEPRAIFYRAKHGFPKASIAIVVQKMINAEKSGTMFTVDPITNENIVLIEAIWGLGESIVAGEVSPDSYKVSKDIGEREEGEEIEKRSEAIIDVRISDKAKMRIYDDISNMTVDVDVPKGRITAQVLTEDEILKLANYGIMIEKHYGNQPQDIEFAIDKNGKATILQTRAITTRTRDYVVTGRPEVRGNQLLTGIGASPGIASGRAKIIFAKGARSDEFRNLKGGEHEIQEANPMLGWHGIRRSLDEPALLKSEFQAIKTMHEQEDLTNLHVMLPFVISTKEVQRAKEVAREVGLPDSAGIGIMVETPASVMIIEDLCKEGIAFASFGTNDLAQLVLGIDRNNERLAKLPSPFHPAILRSMKMVIDVCNYYGVESSICGESGSMSEMAKILVGYGISCNIDVIDTIRAVVYQEEQKLVSK